MKMTTPKDRPKPKATPSQPMRLPCKHQNEGRSWGWCKAGGRGHGAAPDAAAGVTSALQLRAI